MAQRQNTFQIESEAVQGPGSFVVLRRIPWGMQQKASLLLAAAGGGTLPQSEADIRVTAEYLAQNEAYTAELLGTCVVAWNWVDDAGQPLPLPADGGIDALTVDEITFITSALQAKRTDAKN